MRQWGRLSTHPVDTLRPFLAYSAMALTKGLPHECASLRAHCWRGRDSFRSASLPIMASGQGTAPGLAGGRWMWVTPPYRSGRRQHSIGLRLRQAGCCRWVRVASLPSVTGDASRAPTPSALYARATQAKTCHLSCSP